LLNALRSFAQYCVGAELIERDPTIGIKAPKRASDVNRRRTLTPDRRPMLTPLGVGSGLSR
jgi:site-specific recombinase XerC